MSFTRRIWPRGGDARDARGRLARLLGLDLRLYGYRKAYVQNGAKKRPRLVLLPPPQVTALYYPPTL